MLNPDLATLLGFACEAILWGIYVVLFVLCLTFLVWRRRSRHMELPLVIMSIALFVLATTHFGIQFHHYFTHLNDIGVKKFASETIPLAAGDFILSVTDFVGDLVLLYRCWIVWGKNPYIIILPFLTALGGFVCGMVVLNMVVSVGLNRQQPPQSLVQFGTALLTLPLCTNVLVTSLIVGRIFYLAHSTRSHFPKDISTASKKLHRSDRLIWRAASIIIESGMLYLVAQLVLVVLFAIKNPAYKVVGYPIVQIYGIAPTLICCRVGRGVSAEKTYTNTNADLPTFRSQGIHGPKNISQSGARDVDYSHGTTETGTALGDGVKTLGIGDEYEMNYKRY